MPTLIDFGRPEELAEAEMNLGLVVQNLAGAGSARIAGATWQGWPRTNGTPCAFVLGQPNIMGLDHNRAAYYPEDAMNMPYGLTMLGQRRSWPTSRIPGYWALIFPKSRWALGRCGLPVNMALLTRATTAGALRSGTACAGRTMPLDAERLCSLQIPVTIAYFCGTPRHDHARRSGDQSGRPGAGCRVQADSLAHRAEPRSFR